LTHQLVRLLTWKRTIIREEQLPPPRFAQEGFLALGHPPKAACPVPPLKEAQLPGHLHLTAKLACDRHILTVVSASWTCNCKPTHLGVGPTCAVVRDLWSRIDVLPFPQNIWHLLGYLGLRSFTGLGRSLPPTHKTSSCWYPDVSAQSPWTQIEAISSC